MERRVNTATGQTGRQRMTVVAGKSPETACGYERSHRMVKSVERV